MSTNPQATIMQVCYLEKKTRNSHQNTYHWILLWQAKQAVNTNWHHVFHPPHCMFYTWVQQATMYNQAKLAFNLTQQLNAAKSADWSLHKRRGRHEKHVQLQGGMGIGSVSVFLFVWSEMWKSFDNEQSRKRDAHSLHNWRTYCKGGSSAETWDNLDLNFP